MNPQDIYSQIRDQVIAEIQSYSSSRQFDVAKVPSHQHNGTDTNQLQFIGSLSDAPESYSGYAGKAVVCNSTENGLVFANFAPPGTMVAFAVDAVPSGGWLLCNGAAVSRTTYADLFTAIGTTFGTGDGSTTFNVPDARGYTLVGRLPADTAFGTFGSHFGEQRHTLITAEIPAHSHVQQIASVAGGGTGFTVSGNIQTPIATGISTANEGGGGDHNNIQPSLVISWIIKT